MDEQILRNRYKVIQQLGKQAGRKTFLSRDLQTQELVVIKLLSLGSDFEWQDLKLFEREAKTLQTLNHPAIPRYLDYFELDLPDNKGFALVQSYVEGKTLEEHLKGGRTFSEAEVKELAKSLLEILIYLQGFNPPVIHRDIKPSNILLNNRSGHSVGEVYLVDFGSVQTIAAKEGGTITVVGTYGYMPPEQFGGRSTPASDLYSLGATLIYLVTGLHPTELPQKDFRIQFKQAAHLSSNFAAWLEWMTDPSLDKRLTSASQALQALEKPQIRKKNSLVVKKPFSSDIALRKTSEFIEITIPPKGFGFSTIAAISCMIPLLFSSQTLFTSTLESTFFKIFRFGSLSLLTIVIARILFRRIQIRIDSKKITYTYELSGLKWKYSILFKDQDVHQMRLTKKYLRHQLDIAVLSCIRYATFLENQVFGIPGAPYPIENRYNQLLWTKQRLTIRIKGQDYNLIGKGLLTPEELNWLEHELSDWLEVSIIERSYPLT